MYTGVKFLLFVIITIMFLGCGGSKATSVQNSTENNNSVKPNEPQKIIRVACVGDSITLGVGIHSSSHTYPAQLSKYVGKGWEVRNFGSKSATLLKSGSSPYVATNAYENSKNYNPDIVIILLGTNDARHSNWNNKQHFIADYGTLIESYKNLPSQPLVYVCYPPTVKKGKYGVNNIRIQNEIIPKIKQVASIHSVEVVDLYQVFHNSNGLLGDDVHPSIKGAGVIANTVYKAIY